MERTYILAANEVAMALYKQSKGALMNSSCFDFMVYRFSKWDEVLEELKDWEGYVEIEEATYHALYSNLCIKFRGLIKCL